MMETDEIQKPKLIVKDYEFSDILDKDLALILAIQELQEGIKNLSKQ